MGPTRSIVVGIDGSPAGRSALRWAIDEAQRRGATVIAIHAWEPALTVATRGAAYRPEVGDDIANRILDEALHGVDVPEGVPVERRAVRGNPSKAIWMAGEDADLVVVGSRRMGPLGRLTLGSVSTKVIHRASCPVVVVPADCVPPTGPD